MLIQPTTKLQAMVVLTSNADVTSGSISTLPITDPFKSRYTKTQLVPSGSRPWEVTHNWVAGSSLVGVTPNLVASTSKSESVILGSAFSSVPVVWQQELDFQYQELGQALSELTELEEDEEWKIDQPVYQVACHVASELMAFSFPAPTIFTHGPKSVVFNWESDNTNLYLTVSADHMSVLASSPERIKRRLELPKELLNQQKLLPAIQALHSNQPVFATDSSITNPHRFPY